MTRKKKLLWIFRSMAIPLVLGLALGYSGYQLNVIPVIIVGVVLFALGGLGCLIIWRISKRPPKSLLNRWKSYLAIKEDVITDYAVELDAVKSNYLADSNADKNKFEKPLISDIQSFCDFSVLQNGEIYYGCLVRANELLFNPSEDIDEAFPAMLLYSRDEHYKSAPEDLCDIADELYKNSDKNDLRYETLYHFNEKLDEAQTGGREVFLTDILICRAQVPMGMLGGLRIIPIIANPDNSKSSFVVDCKYWTNKLIHAYIHTGNDGPPDTYGDPFAEVTAYNTDKQ